MKIIILSIILLSSISAQASLFSEDRTWEFMQSVGGITLGKLEHTGKAWYLPVQCDVSGLKTFTVKPKTVNSALVWSKTKFTVQANEIFITIQTKLTGKNAQDTTACSGVALENIQPGTYHVLYRDPEGGNHPIGEIQIGL